MNVFDAFDAMRNGYIVKDYDLIWYKKDDDGKLIESYNEGTTWEEVEEFTFGCINIEWRLVETGETQQITLNL
jgi:hypothetical protein